MTFEQQFKALIYYHLEEYASRNHLVQALEEDDFARNEIAPPDGIKKSSFSEAVNHRGRARISHLFNEIMVMAIYTHRELILGISG
ncbi:MAG: hypothetical protein GY941_10520 [Planctomycetes bacterium]|nr:hypothetical protein [Planctomycetota bacterium]